MEIKPESLDGLTVADAKEYILGFISTLKLTEKEIQKLNEEEALWERRVNLARDQNETGLALEAVNELERIRAKKAGLEAEARELEGVVVNLRAQLQSLPAKERSVDTDLLEQELLMLTGRMPGTEQEAARDRALEKLEKEAAAAAALEALKSRMGVDAKR